MGNRPKSVTALAIQRKSANLRATAPRKSEVFTRLSELSELELCEQYFERVFKATLPEDERDELKKKFLLMLAVTYSKALACVHVGITTRTIDKWLTTDGDFYQGYNDAIKICEGRLKHVAYERALNGSDSLAAKFLAAQDEKFNEKTVVNQVTANYASAKTGTESGAALDEIKQLLVKRINEVNDIYG